MVLTVSDVTLVRACGLNFISFCSSEFTRSTLLAGDAGAFTQDTSTGALLVPIHSFDSEEVSAEEVSDRDLSEVDDGSPRTSLLLLLSVLGLVRPLDGAGGPLRG